MRGIKEGLNEKGRGPPESRKPMGRKKRRTQPEDKSLEGQKERDQMG